MSSFDEWVKMNPKDAESIAREAREEPKSHVECIAVINMAGHRIIQLEEELIGIKKQLGSGRAERLVALMEEPCPHCGGTVGPQPGIKPLSLMCYGCAPPEAARPAGEHIASEIRALATPKANSGEGEVK